MGLSADAKFELKGQEYLFISFKYSGGEAAEYAAESDCSCSINKRCNGSDNSSLLIPLVVPRDM